MTVGIPPGSLELHSTIRRTHIVVLVFGGEEVVVVGPQRITCSQKMWSLQLLEKAVPP